MGDALHSLWFYLRFDKWRWVVCNLLAVAFAVVICTNWQWVGVTRPADLYWDKFIPLAQLAIVFGLAYVALPYFRHTQAMMKRSAKIIGQSKEQQRGFSKRLNALPMEVTRDWPELVAISDICNLVEARAFARRAVLFEGNLTAAERATLAAHSRWKFGSLDQVRHYYQKASGHTCLVQDGARNRWLKTFFLGADVVCVLYGVLLAAAVHVLALLERVYHVSMGPLLQNDLIQLAIAASIVGWGCMVPIWFAYQGTRLSTGMEEFFYLASQQKEAMDAREAEGAQSAVRGALQQQPQAQQPARRRRPPVAGGWQG